MGELLCMFALGFVPCILMPLLLPFATTYFGVRLWTDKYSLLYTKPHIASNASSRIALTALDILLVCLLLFQLGAMVFLGMFVSTDHLQLDIDEPTYQLLFVAELWLFTTLLVLAWWSVRTTSRFMLGGRGKWHTVWQQWIVELESNSHHKRPKNNGKTAGDSKSGGDKVVLQCTQ